MKILFWQWNAFMQKGIERAFNKLNMEYVTFYHVPGDWEKDEIFKKALKTNLDADDYDVVFSVNYAPVVSNVCEEKNIKYVSWVYDSPVHIRDVSSFANKCNRIYFFDRGQVERYSRAGYENVFHMPLAADEMVWKESLGKGQAAGGGIAGGLADSDKYSCDVAFVGQLYKSDYSYLLGPLSQYYRGVMEGMICAQGQLYGAYLLDEMITDELMKELNVFYGKASNGKSQVKREEMEYACACEVTGRERFMALSLLAKRYNVNLYSKDSGKEIEGIHHKGYADYYTQMPLAFSMAKVNLNISLKTIKTGIPLRVLDVLSCGGFLITNYQEELLEYFEPGVDLVVYTDIGDLIYKVDYYLKHEEERKLIAQNGLKKVRELFAFEDKITKIFSGI